MGLNNDKHIHNSRSMRAHYVNYGERERGGGGGGGGIRRSCRLNSFPGYLRSKGQEEDEGWTLVLNIRAVKTSVSQRRERQVILGAGVMIIIFAN